MALVYARKVNQQCLYVEQVLQMAEQTGGNPAQASLVQAGYLQLELAVRLYALELVADKGASNAQLEFVSAAALTQLSAQAPSAELSELVDLLQRPNSWLATFVNQLSTLRGGEPEGKLKGELFQVDEQQDAQADRITLQDISGRPKDANAEFLKATFVDFKQLVERQRAIRAEY